MAARLYKICKGASEAASPHRLFNAAQRWHQCIYTAITAVSCSTSAWGGDGRNEPEWTNCFAKWFTVLKRSPHAGQNRVDPNPIANNWSLKCFEWSLVYWNHSEPLFWNKWFTKDWKFHEAALRKRPSLAEEGQRRHSSVWILSSLNSAV